MGIPEILEFREPESRIITCSRFREISDVKIRESVLFRESRFAEFYGPNAKLFL